MVSGFQLSLILLTFLIFFFFEKKNQKNKKSKKVEICKPNKRLTNQKVKLEIRTAN